MSPDRPEHTKHLETPNGVSQDTSHGREGADGAGTGADVETIERAELVRIVNKATTGLTESTRAKLLAVAETTDAIAVGWWHCDGVSCPARQARRKNQTFQTAFDAALGERFGREWDDEGQTPFEPFVVRVV